MNLTPILSQLAFFIKINYESFDSEGKSFYRGAVTILTSKALLNEHFTGAIITV
jgi:hypothetical protein